MKIQYIEKTKIAYFNGYRFTKDDKTGYYLGASKIDGKRHRLHRYIWEYYNGEIPEGYDIHHIDHNKDNNELKNLELISRSKHSKLHNKELTEEQKQKRKENMINNVIPKAIEWHKSAEAKQFHRKQYLKSLAIREKEKYICENCGMEYEAYKNRKNKFCSNKCKSAWRRKNNVDNEERHCSKCGEIYKCNRYSLRKLCNKCQNKKKVHSGYKV